MEYLVDAWHAPSFCSTLGSAQPERLPRSHADAKTGIEWLQLRVPCDAHAGAGHVRMENVRGGMGYLCYAAVLELATPRKAAEGIGAGEATSPQETRDAPIQNE